MNALLGPNGNILRITSFVTDKTYVVEVSYKLLLIYMRSVQHIPMYFNS